MIRLLLLMLLLLPVLSGAQEGAGTGEDPVADDEKVLDEMEASRIERQKKLDALSKLGQEPKDNLTLDPDEQLDKMGMGSFNPKKLLSPENLAATEKLLLEAKLHERSPEEVRESIRTSFKGSGFGNYLERHPGAMNFVVDFMRDEKAVLSGVRILKDRDRLKTYLYIWIVLMFAAYYTKRLFISSFWPRPTRVFAAVLFSLTVSTISLSAFFLVFHEETRPIAALIRKHL